MTADRRPPLRVALLGSGGSIGRQAIDVLVGLGDAVRVVALATGSQAGLLEEQARRCRPIAVALDDAAALAGLDLPSGTERVAQPDQDVDRLTADRAARSEERHPERRMPVRGHRRKVSTNRVMTGAASRNESTRSRTPPWPGIRSLEFRAPAARLSIDSARSPHWAARPTIGPRSRP